MISIAHTGDGTNVWDGATLYVDTYDTDGTWSFDTRFARSDVSAVEVLADIVTWAAATVFGADPGLVLEWTALADGRLAFQLRQIYAGGWSQFNASAGLAALLGWPAGATVISGGYVLPESTPPGAYATVGSEVQALENWTRWGRGRGPASAGAAWSLGVASSELRRPDVRAVMTEAQVVALADAQAAASLPRRARVYDPAYEVWREVAVGAVTVELDGDMLYRVGLEVLG